MRPWTRPLAYRTSTRAPRRTRERVSSRTRALPRPRAVARPLEPTNLIVAFTHLRSSRLTTHTTSFFFVSLQVILIVMRTTFRFDGAAETISASDVESALPALLVAVTRQLTPRPMSAATGT